MQLLVSVAITLCALNVHTKYFVNSPLPPSPSPSVPQAFFHACPFSVLTLSEVECFVGDTVNLTCLQQCGAIPEFCHPALYNGNKSIKLFPEHSATTMYNNCSYYVHTLVGVNISGLAADKITCGGQLQNGTYRLSEPLDMFLKQSELLAS